MERPNPIQRLIASLSRLPGVGEKTAARLALFLVNCPKEQALELARSIEDACHRVQLCRQCFNFSEQGLCAICASAGRDQSTVCVVETPGDILSIERSGAFSGTYHVLHGVIAPLDGVGPEQLRLQELFDRVGRGNVREVILATNPTMNGNATAVFIAGRLKDCGVLVTRIAQGVPSGADIGYTDQTTLRSALAGRRSITP